MNGDGLITRSARYTSNGCALLRTRSRWLGTNWKMSPALMYSLPRVTASSNSARVMLLSNADATPPDVSISPDSPATGCCSFATRPPPPRRVDPPRLPRHRLLQLRHQRVDPPARVVIRHPRVAPVADLRVCD